jgi:hypothetical protein
VTGPPGCSWASWAGPEARRCREAGQRGLLQLIQAHSVSLLPSVPACIKKIQKSKEKRRNNRYARTTENQHCATGCLNAATSHLGPAPASRVVGYGHILYSYFYFLFYFVVTCCDLPDYERACLGGGGLAGEAGCGIRPPSGATTTATTNLAADSLVTTGRRAGVPQVARSTGSPFGLRTRGGVSGSAAPTGAWAKTRWHHTPLCLLRTHAPRAFVPHRGMGT